MACTRCSQTLPAGSMGEASRFNGDLLCPRCAERERAHPDYPGKGARRAGSAPAVLYRAACKAEEFVITIRHLAASMAAGDRSQAFAFPDGSEVALPPNGHPRVLAYATTPRRAR